MVDSQPHCITETHYDKNLLMNLHIANTMKNTQLSVCARVNKIRLDGKYAQTKHLTKYH